MARSSRGAPSAARRLASPASPITVRDANGVTYNIYSDPKGANRPWALDPVPFLISPEEWRYIEAGVVQRAQLLSIWLRANLTFEQR